jgi:hypothetical protein
LRPGNLNQHCINSIHRRTANQSNNLHDRSLT